MDIHPKHPLNKSPRFIRRQGSIVFLTPCMDPLEPPPSPPKKPKCPQPRKPADTMPRVPRASRARFPRQRSMSFLRLLHTKKHSKPKERQPLCLLTDTSREQLLRLTTAQKVGALSYRYGVLADVIESLLEQFGGDERGVCDYLHQRGWQSLLRRPESV
jgi:hypothetical protein